MNEQPVWRQTRLLLHGKTPIDNEAGRSSVRGAPFLSENFYHQTSRYVADHDQKLSDLQLRVGMESTRLHILLEEGRDIASGEPFSACWQHNTAI